MNATYAGAGRRFVAVMLDGLIILAIFIILEMAFGLIGLGKSWDPMLTVLINIISLAIQIGYFVFYQASSRQTLGKKVMGIRVVTTQGTKPSAGTFFLREVIGKLVSAIILFIGYLMILWDAKKQGLHDKIAGTVVVKV